jgi:hypothetical protein
MFEKAGVCEFGKLLTNQNQYATGVFSCSCFVAVIGGVPVKRTVASTGIAL